MKLRAIGRHLIVKMDQDAVEDVSRGGIVLPTDAVSKERGGVQTGVVLSVGPSCFDDQPPLDGGHIKAGDRIVTARYPGTGFYTSPEWRDKKMESPYRIILDTEVRAVEDKRGVDVGGA